MSALSASPVRSSLLLLIPLIKSQMTDFIHSTLLSLKKRGFEHNRTPPEAPTQASSQVTYAVPEERSNPGPASVTGTSKELGPGLCSLVAAWPLSEKRPLPDREEGCNSLSRVYGPHHRRPYISSIKTKVAALM